MGLAEKLSEWLLRRRERQEERNMRQVAAYFGSLLNKRRADAGAILQSVRDYRDCPEVTRKQAELLLEHRFFRYVYQTGYPEWRAVMDALKETRYGMREGAAIPRSVKEAAESPRAVPTSGRLPSIQPVQESCADTVTESVIQVISPFTEQTIRKNSSRIF